MIETAGIRWYKVKKCGYYKNRQADIPEFGTLGSTVQDLVQWGVGKQLRETQTFGPDASDSPSEQLPVYLLDARGFGDNWLLTLWNEVPATSGKVASVSSTSLVGRPDVVMNQLKDGSIPGHATYFYVVPSMNAIAGVRFQHVVYGHLAMRAFLSGFLRLCGSHAVYSAEGNDDGELELVGYSKGPGWPPMNLKAAFVSEVLRQAGQRELITNRALEIRKVVRRAELLNGRTPDRDFWQTLMTRVGLASPPATPSAVRVQYEVQTRLSNDELAQMIDAWDEQGAAVADWDDIGFIFAGESSVTHWLTQSLAKTDIELDVARDSEEVVNPATLLDQLVSHREAITSAIRP